MRENILLLSCLFFVSLNLCGVEWERGWFVDRVKEMGPDGVVSYIKDVVIKDVGVERGVLKKAMKEGRYFFVKDLMERDVDEKGRTVLHEAAARGEFEIVRALVDIGADINAVDKEGKTALHEAVQVCNDRIIEWLLRNFGKYTINEKGEVFYLKSYGSFESERQILWDDRVTLEFLMVTDEGESAKRQARYIFWWLSRNESLCEAVKFLIEEGADLNVKDRNGRVPLFGLNELVRELLKGEIRSNEEGKTLWGYACRVGKEISDYIFAS